MKARSAVILGIVLMFGTATFAQDYAKIEIPMYYSYMRFNPQNNGILSGFSLNGGGGGVTFFFNHLVGIEAEFNGYASTTQTFTFAPPVVTPHANTPCPSGPLRTFRAICGNALRGFTLQYLHQFREGLPTAAGCPVREPDSEQQCLGFHHWRRHRHYYVGLDRHPASAV